MSDLGTPTVVMLDPWQTKATALCLGLDAHVRSGNGITRLVIWGDADPDTLKFLSNRLDPYWKSYISKPKNTMTIEKPQRKKG